MTKMLIDRSVVEQMLEALEGGADSWQRVGPAIDALKAALKEPDIDPVDEYRKGFIDGQIDMRDRPEEPVQEPVRLQCTTCGTVYADGVPPQVPVQEPVGFKDAPERIWLQACEDDHCEVPFREHDEITWCAEQQNPLDVPYVRADLASPPQRKPLTDEQKQAIHNETGAGHSLICLVESYINGIKENT